MNWEILFCSASASVVHFEEKLLAMVCGEDEDNEHADG